MDLNFAAFLMPRSSYKHAKYANFKEHIFEDKSVISCAKT